MDSHTNKIFRSFILFLALAFSLCSARTVIAQTCAVPPGATRVNDNDQPDPSGNWCLLLTGSTTTRPMARSTSTTRSILRTPGAHVQLSGCRKPGQ